MGYIPYTYQGCIWGVSRVYPGCIIDLSIGVYGWIVIYQGCSRGVHPGEESAGGRGPTTLARDKSAWMCQTHPQIHIIYISGYTIDT